MDPYPRSKTGALSENKYRTNTVPDYMMEDIETCSFQKEVVKSLEGLSPEILATAMENLYRIREEKTDALTQKQSLSNEKTKFGLIRSRVVFLPKIADKVKNMQQHLREAGFQESVEMMLPEYNKLQKKLDTFMKSIGRQLSAYQHYCLNPTKNKPLDSETVNANRDNLDLMSKKYVVFYRDLLQKSIRSLSQDIKTEGYFVYKRKIETIISYMNEYKHLVSSFYDVEYEVFKDLPTATKQGLTIKNANQEKADFINLEEKKIEKRFKAMLSQLLETVSSDIEGMKGFGTLSNPALLSKLKLRQYLESMITKHQDNIPGIEFFLGKTPTTEKIIEAFFYGKTLDLDKVSSLKITPEQLAILQKHPLPISEKDIDDRINTIRGLKPLQKEQLKVIFLEAKEGQSQGFYELVTLLEQSTSRDDIDQLIREIESLGDLPKEQQNTEKISTLRSIANTFGRFLGIKPKAKPKDDNLIERKPQRTFKESLSKLKSDLIKIRDTKVNGKYVFKKSIKGTSIIRLMMKPFGSFTPEDKQAVDEFFRKLKSARAQFDKDLDELNKKIGDTSISYSLRKNAFDKLASSYLVLLALAGVVFTGTLPVLIGAVKLPFKIGKAAVKTGINTGKKLSNKTTLSQKEAAEVLAKKGVSQKIINKMLKAGLATWFLMQINEISQSDNPMEAIESAALSLSSGTGLAMAGAKVPGPWMVKALASVSGAVIGSLGGEKFFQKVIMHKLERDCPNRNAKTSDRIKRDEMLTVLGQTLEVASGTSLAKDIKDMAMNSFDEDDDPIEFLERSSVHIVDGVLTNQKRNSINTLQTLAAERIQTLKKDLSTAKRKGDTDEVKKLNKAIEKLSEIVDGSWIEKSFIPLTIQEAYFFSDTATTKKAFMEQAQKADPKNGATMIDLFLKRSITGEEIVQTKAEQKVWEYLYDNDLESNKIASFSKYMGIYKYIKEKKAFLLKLKPELRAYESDL